MPAPGRRAARWRIHRRRKPSEIARLGLGRTFQTSQLFRGMTVLENMMTGLHHRTRRALIATSLNLRRYREEEEADGRGRPTGARVHRHVGLRGPTGLGALLRPAARHRDRPTLISDPKVVLLMNRRSDSASTAFRSSTPAASDSR